MARSANFEEPGDCAPSHDNTANDDENISVLLLEVGTILDRDILDDDDVLLLRAGHEITQRFIDQIRNHGIQDFHKAKKRSETAKQRPSNDTTQVIQSGKRLQTPTTNRLDRVVDQA